MTKTRRPSHILWTVHPADFLYTHAGSEALYTNLGRRHAPSCCHLPGKEAVESRRSLYDRPSRCKAMLFSSKPSDSALQPVHFVGTYAVHKRKHKGECALVASDVCHGAQRVIHLGAAAHHTRSHRLARAKMRG